MTDVEDREQVRELHARYCHGVDHADRHEEWVHLFTSDAVLISNVASRLEGHDGVRSLANGMAAAASNGVTSRHVIANLAMTLHGETGTTESTLLVFNTVEGHTTLFLVGTYKATVVKVAKNWLFKTLDLHVDTDIGQGGAGAGA